MDWRVGAGREVERMAAARAAEGCDGDNECGDDDVKCYSSGVRKASACYLQYRRLHLRLTAGISWGQLACWEAAAAFPISFALHSQVSAEARGLPSHLQHHRNTPHFPLMFPLPSKQRTRWPAAHGQPQCLGHAGAIGQDRQGPSRPQRGDGRAET